MKQLRTVDDSFGDSLESAIRRFFSPAIMDTEKTALQMRIDVDENQEAYTVKADIPGARKEDINIQVDGNVVRSDAEMTRENQTKENGGKLVRSERYWGDVSRTFSLAHDIDESKTSANYRDGVLTLNLPKKAGAASRKIVVQ